MSSTWMKSEPVRGKSARSQSMTASAFCNNLKAVRRSSPDEASLCVSFTSKSSGVLYKLSEKVAADVHVDAVELECDPKKKETVLSTPLTQVRLVP